MTIHKAYLQYPNLDSEWYNFSKELPDFLLEDERLFNLFSKYPFLEDKDDEILKDFSVELSDELENWAYVSKKNQITEEKLFSIIYSIANDTLKEVIAKYIPIELSHFVPKSDFFYSIDDVRNYEALLELDEETELEFDTNHQFANAESDFIGFKFQKNKFFKILKEWKISPFRMPKAKIIQKSPLVKIFTQFDPIIYQLIKKNPDLLRTLDWRIFEEMLADILRRLNYVVELTRATKDGGIDIIAFGKDENFGTHKYLLQAKRYQDAVQVSPVRELLFLHDEHKATKSCLATTSTFTSGAWKLAEIHKWKLELKDQKGILNWIDRISP